MRRREALTVRALVLVLLTPLLVACGGVKVVESWDDGAFRGPVDQVLVLMPNLALVPDQQEYARIQLVEALRAEGFRVLTREAFFGASAQFTSAELARELAGSGVDGVLVLIPGRVEMTARGNPDFVDVRLGYVNFEDEITQLFATGGRREPEARGDDTRKELTVHLFPASGGALVWERRLSFNNPGSWLDVVDLAAPKIASELARSGLGAAGN